MSENEYNFEEIYKNFKPQIHRYIARMIGEGEAEDLTQEVFVKVNKALPDFQGRSSISTWIYRIANNTTVDMIRSASYKKDVDEYIPDDALITEDLSPWKGQKVLSMDSQLIEKEMNDCIRDFINRLSENYRSVLVLSELECLKNREIADIMGITLDTVKIRLHRARASLRAVLEGNCNFYQTAESRLA